MIEFENKKMINKFLNGTPHRLHLETKQIEKTYKKGPLSQTITISAYLQSTPYTVSIHNNGLQDTLKNETWPHAMCPVSALCTQQHLCPAMPRIYRHNERQSFLANKNLGNTNYLPIIGKFKLSCWPLNFSFQTLLRWRRKYLYWSWNCQYKINLTKRRFV